MSAIPLQREVYYPDSDGEPMAETEVHAREMVYVFEAFEDQLASERDVYVGMNMFLYYVEGNPSASVAPDVFMVWGVPRGVRRTYKLWEEGRPPSIVVEVTSSSTRKKDKDEKKPLYESLGVEELILHDPLGDYLKPPLQGYRLVFGRYQPIPLDEDGSLLSRVTGLRFRPEPEGIGLRLVDEATGRIFLTSSEKERKLAREEAARRAAEAKAVREEAARHAAEEEIARLKAELERARRRS
jgi:Uma2 family endonuclease